MNDEMMLQSSSDGPAMIKGGLNITAGHLYIGGDLHLDGSLLHDIGNVSFSGGDFSIDGDTFFIDNSNNRIGIGTSEPARTLHIQDDNGMVRIDRDANSPAFMLSRFPNNNYTIPWKTFVVGVAADGSDNGTFHITDFGTSVSGGGDRRLTIENDGTVDILGDLVADKIYLQDSGSDYMDWQSGDGVFRFSSGLDVGNTLFASDISGGDWTGATIDATDYVETPLIYNTDGDTLTVQDKLDVTGLISSYVGLNTTEISNTLGDLKIQPDVQGNVELFGDTDVANNEAGKEFIVWRRAPEGNDKVRIYCGASRTCYIHSSNDLTLQAQVPFTINSVTEDIIFKVGDNAGTKKFYFKDSDGTEIANIDSDGNAWFAGSVGIGVNSPSGNLKLDVAGSNPIIRISSTKNGEWIVGEQLGALEFYGSDGSSPGAGVKAEIGIPARTTYGNWFDITFKIQNTSGELNELMRIVQNGNVGIGTDNPQEKLHVVGDFFVEGSVRFNDTFFTDSGEVGIGIVNPDEKLHVYDGNMRIESTSDPTLYFTRTSDNDTFGFKYDESENDFSIIMGNNNRNPSFLDDIMTFTPSFYVGIKNSNPTHELDVNGNTFLDGTLEITGIISPLQFASIAEPKLNLYGSNYAIGVESSELRISSNARITFRTDGYDGNEDMIIEDDGDVLMLNGKLGLKTPTPQEELHINSTNPQIIFEEYDAGNSEKVWEIGATNEEFLIRTQSDLYSASQTVFRIGCRGGTSIGCIDFPHGDVTISDLSGSGNDYACLDSTGKLFRSNSAC